MQIDPKEQTRTENYKLLIGSVLPRPIAFVTSQDAQGVVNAAPFSFFSAICAAPPLISIACARKADGRMKDTARNIKENGEFVVHVVDEENVEEVNDTAVEFPSDVSEVETVGFDLLPSTVIQVPRIAQSKVQMECILHQMLSLGEASGTDFIIGEVVQFHIQDEIYEAGRILTEQLKPVGRLAGTVYTKVGETFARKRPSYEEWLKREEGRR